MKHSALIHEFTSDEIVATRSDLLAWFDINKREMPWRKTVDYAVSSHAPIGLTRTQTMTKDDLSQRAYEVWISEIMLQQVGHERCCGLISEDSSGDSYRLLQRLDREVANNCITCNCHT